MQNRNAFVIDDDEMVDERDTEVLENELDPFGCDNILRRGFSNAVGMVVREHCRGGITLNDKCVHLFDRDLGKARKSVTDGLCMHDSARGAKKDQINLFLGFSDKERAKVFH